MDSGFARAAAVVLACAIALAYGAIVASADTGYRIRVERIDTLSYPNIRVVASVVDANGKPVRGLGAGDLAVTEEGTAVPARVDLASSNTSVALAFVLDASGSMAGGPLQEAVTLSTSMGQRLGPRDQTALITFRDAVELVQPLSTDKAAFAAATRRIVPDRSTPLASWRAFDGALLAATDTLRGSAPGSRGAIVLVSDGFDASSSAAQKAQAVAQARGSVYPIYALAVGAQLDRATFRAIADASGGQAFFAPSTAELAVAYGALGEQILTQYSITYYSAFIGHPGEGRTIRLQLSRGGAVVAETTVAYAIPISAADVVRGAAPGSAPAASEGPKEQSTTAVREGDDRTIPWQLAAGRALGVGGIADPAASVAVLGAAAAFSLFLFIVNDAFASGSRLRARLLRFVPAATNAAVDELRRPLSERLIGSTLTAMGRRLSQVTPQGLINSSAAALEQAGTPLGLGPVEFLGLRALSAVALTVVLSIAAVAASLPAEAVVVTLVLGLPVGLILPAVVLGSLVRRRKKEILTVLPSTVDMVALSVEAGLAFDGAIAQVALRRRNALADEFRRLLVEFQMGRPRREALGELARRGGVPELARLVAAVTQADQLGAPLSKVLADFAFELRTRRRQRAEELARTAPIKMLFPMVGLIFPALFVVILGPAVPRLMALFTQVH